MAHWSDRIDPSTIPEGSPFIPANSAQRNEWVSLMRDEIAALGITRGKAQAWLVKYRGCVGTELYEFAATIQSVNISISAEMSR